MLDALKVFVETCQKNSNTGSSRSQKCDSSSKEKDSQSVSNDHDSSQDDAMPDPDPGSLQVQNFTVEMYTSKSRKYTKAKKQFRVS